MEEALNKLSIFFGSTPSNNIKESKSHKIMNSFQIHSKHEISELKKQLEEKQQIIYFHEAFERKLIDILAIKFIKEENSHKEEIYEDYYKKKNKDLKQRLIELEKRLLLETKKQKVLFSENIEDKENKINK